MSGLDLQPARISAGEIAYADEGEGPAVLLLHGFPTSSHLWRDLVPMLAPRFRAIAPDLLGYGASEKPAETPDLEGQAACVRELLETLGVEELAVVGHDVGGAVAQLLALEHPGVRALVLLDSMPMGATPIEAVRTLQGMDPGAADAATAERLVRAAFDIGMRHRERLHELDLEAFIAPWRRDPAAAIRAARGIGPAGPGTEALAAVEVPAMVIWGEDDPFLPSKLAERLWETLPDCAIALLPGCGHFVSEDAPETVLPLVAQFLRSRYLGKPGHDHDTAGPVTVELGISFERPTEAEELVDE